MTRLGQNSRGPTEPQWQLLQSVPAIRETSATTILAFAWRAEGGRPPVGRDASAQPIKILLHEIAAHLGDVGVDQAPGDRTRGAAVADLGAVEATHARDA